MHATFCVWTNFFFPLTRIPLNLVSGFNKYFLKGKSLIDPAIRGGLVYPRTMKWSNLPP
jgi:hypothetical protein